MPITGLPYDVFLSHDHEDAEAIEKLGRLLRARYGFRVWLDRWICVPGESWQQTIVKGLSETTTCAVCIGGRTPSGWFRQEIERALELQAADHRYRVIPVLLPGAAAGEPEDLVPGFLSLRTWVDFRSGDRDPYALHLLQHGIQGTSPGPWPPAPDDYPVDATPDEIERDLMALYRYSRYLDERVVIKTQRAILARRFT